MLNQYTQQDEHGQLMDRMGIEEERARALETRDEYTPVATIAPVHPVPAVRMATRIMQAFCIYKTGKGNRCGTCADCRDSAR